MSILVIVMPLFAHGENWIARSAPKIAATADDTAPDGRQAAGATAMRARGKGVIVAVIDTGISRNTAELGFLMGPTHKIIGGWDFIDEDDDPYDWQGWGTYVAGLIAANSGRMSGVAPDARLLAYRVFDHEGRTTPDRVAAAIRRAVADGAMVINLSFELPGAPDDEISQAVDEAEAAGVVVCAAAGGGSQTGTIPSPAGARGAIAVGWSETYPGELPHLRGASHGPTRITMAYKPDLIAPGTARSIARSWSSNVYGADVSTALVSGMAALLRERHPTWTPAEIKSALVTTARALTEEFPLRTGGGAADPERADAAYMHFDQPSLMFGVHAAKSGTSVTRRVLTMTNRLITPQRFTVTSTTTAGPISMKIIPSEVLVPASGTAQVEIELTLDYDNLPFPEDLVIGGRIDFDGSTDYHVPWAAMRGARMSIQSDDIALLPTTAIHAFGDGTMHTILPWARGRAELWVTPGTYDVLHVAREDANAKQVVIAEDQILDGVNVVALRGSTATLPLDLRGTDEGGRVLRELPEDANFSKNYESHLFIGHHRAGAGLRTPLRDSAILVSPSKRFTFVGSEIYTDAEEKRVFSLLHEPLHGISKPETLTGGGSAYKRATLDLPPLTRVCLGSAITFTGTSHSYECPLQTMSGDVAYFASNDTDFVAQGAIVRNNDFRAPLLRAIGPEFVFGGFHRNPQPSAYRFRVGERVSFPSQPAYPGIVPGSFTHWQAGEAGYFGPLGERFVDSKLVTWWLYDTNGSEILTGSIDKNEFLNSTWPGKRYVARHRRIEGEVEVRLAADWQYPALTSLRVVDALGRIATSVEAGRTAWIEFSAANWSPNRQLAMRPEATRVQAGVVGSGLLRDLSFVVSGEDNGTYAELGHPAAGELYRVDLRPLSDLRGPIEIVIGVEDVAGTRVSWRHPSAFTIVDPTPGRRRSMRP